MFKPTPPQLSRVRLRLTTKAVNKGYYKGNRTGSVGAHTAHARYVMDYRKVRTFVCPQPEEYENFHLTPFVTKEMTPTRELRPRWSKETGQFERGRSGPVDGQRFLEDVAYHNPEEIVELSAQPEYHTTTPRVKHQTLAPALSKKSWNQLSTPEKKLFRNDRQKWTEAKGKRELSDWYESEVAGKGLGKRYWKNV